MQRASRTTAIIAATLAVAALARAGEAQERSNASATESKSLVTVTPGPSYRAGALTRAILGSGWRDLWVTPIQVPVLDLATYAGGLKLEERGGGAQSIVLHLKEDDGWKEYRFRSVDKFALQAAPDEVKGTLVGRLFQDQVSVLFPAASIMVPPYLDAVGVLHVKPELYVMGDSPRLEHVRDTLRGMLGAMELKGEEAPDDKPGFAGSTSVKGSEKFFEDIMENRGHRVDEHEFLAARLVDFLINDTDRTPDNFDWARFGEKGQYTWRPLPRDRDHAFLNAGGLVNSLALRKFYPKQVPFTPTFNLKGLTYSSHELDRKLLQRLTAKDFQDVALRVQRSVTDDVIARSIATLPASWREKTDVDETLWAALRTRRDNLPAVAMAFYRDLAGEVDVHGTDEADRIDVVRHPDGRVTVTVTDPERPAMIAERRENGRVVSTSDGSVESVTDRGAWYVRTFVPGETNEVRVYAHGGNDIATVTGVATGPIKVRLIGGKGDDAMADHAGGDETHLYDSEGSNILRAADGTHIDTRHWKPLKPLTGLRVGGDWRPDWGGSKGWKPAVDYNTGAGLILGIGPRFKSYGFRRLPHHWEAGANFMVGTGNGKVGFNVDLDYREENSPMSFRLDGRATQLEDTRFFGYGNNTPKIDRQLNLIEQTEVVLEPAMAWAIGWRAREDTGNLIRGRSKKNIDSLRPLVGELRMGPVLGWINPNPPAFSPLLVSGVRGSDDFGLAGARVALELDQTNDDAVPTRGFTVELDLAAYPPFLGLDNAFGTASASTSYYLPLSRGMGPHLAFRAGGALAAGDYPAQYSAFVGGRSTLRGFSYRRFAGDASANGSAELRVPVGTVNFLVKSKLGVFALADAGRVWFDGASDGGFHSALGGGVWLSALGRSFSVAYAKGESRRIYLNSGLSF